MSRDFPGGQSLEFCHYAEIGRNLAAGRGLRTEVLYPAEAALLAARGADFGGPVRVVGRFPLFAVLVGAAQAVLGPTDAAVLAAAGFALAFAAAAAAWVLTPWLGAGGAAAAALAFALSPAVLRGFAQWGTPDLLFCALWLLFHDAWTRRADARLTGLLAALCWLARPNAVLFVPVYLAEVLYYDPGRLRWALGAGATAAAAGAPWAWVQWRDAGVLLNPNGLWNLAGGVLTEEPGWRYARTLSLSEFDAEKVVLLGRKALAGLWRWLSLAPRLWQMAVLAPLALLAVGMVGREPDAERRRWWPLCGVLLAVQVLAFAPLRVESLGDHVAGRYELWFAPVWAALAVLGWRRAVERSRWLPWTAPVALLGLGMWYARVYSLPELGFGHPAGAPAAWPELAAAAPADAKEFVATNIPGHAGWYGRRRAVLLPAGEDEFERLRGLLPVGPVLVSTLPVGQVTDMPYWLSLLRERAAADRFCARFGYRIAHASPQALVLVPDKPRT